MSDDPVTVLVRYRIREGRREELRAELETLIERVLEEPGCEGITLHTGVTHPDEILLYELWSDAETYLGPHSETPHLQAFIAKARPLLEEMPEITLWQRAG